MTSVDMLRTPGALADAERWTAHNYHPLPVVVAEADGAWVTDVDGRRYLDCLAGYSALNFGHRHPASNQRHSCVGRCIDAGDQVVLLENEPDVGQPELDQLRIGQRVNVGPEHPHLAFGRPQDAAHDRYQRGLA